MTPSTATQANTDDPATGRSPDPILAWLNRMAAARRRSTTELLHELRQAFPDAPLSARVAALKLLR